MILDVVDQLELGKDLGCMTPLQNDNFSVVVVATVYLKVHAPAWF
jgi:hypothetical protein